MNRGGTGEERSGYININADFNDYIIDREVKSLMIQIILK